MARSAVILGATKQLSQRGSRRRINLHASLVALVASGLGVSSPGALRLRASSRSRSRHADGPLPRVPRASRVGARRLDASRRRAPAAATIPSRALGGSPLLAASARAAPPPPRSRPLALRSAAPRAAPRAGASAGDAETDAAAPPRPRSASSPSTPPDAPLDLETAAPALFAAFAFAFFCAAEPAAAAAASLADGTSSGSVLDGASSAEFGTQALWSVAGGEVPFWANMVKYARFSISIMVGTAFMFGRPIVNLLKKPQTAVLVIGGVRGV